MKPKKHRSRTDRFDSSAVRSNGMAAMFDRLDEMPAPFAFRDMPGHDGIVDTLFLLLGRAFAFTEVWDDERQKATLVATVDGVDKTIRATRDFPMTIAQLARFCADAVAHVPHAATATT